METFLTGIFGRIGDIVIGNYDSEFVNAKWLLSWRIRFDHFKELVFRYHCNS